MRTVIKIKEGGVAPAGPAAGANKNSTKTYLFCFRIFQFLFYFCIFQKHFYYTFINYSLLNNQLLGYKIARAKNLYNLKNQNLKRVKTAFQI